MTNYEIKTGGIQNQTEKTSAIALISYEIENARFNKLSHERIVEQINGLVKDNKFPAHLLYIDSFYDNQTSLSGVAFQDSYTGNITIGFAGTNFDNGVVAAWQDIQADISIAINGDIPTNSYFKEGNEFIEKVKKANYTIDMLTGHSKGGRDAILLGMIHQIPQMIVYNSAPLNNLGGAIIANRLQPIKKMERISNAERLQRLIGNYEGKLIQIVSENDPLNQYARLFYSSYPGETIFLKNGGGHDMHQFLSKETQQKLKEKLTQISDVLPVHIELVKQMVIKQLAELKNLKSNLLTNSQEKLTATQRIYLEASESLIIATGMEKILQKELLDWQDIYRQAIREAKQLWRQTISEARVLGSLLSEAECEEALRRGEATRQMIVQIPVADYEIALQQLQLISQNYEALLKKIQQTINRQLETDQQLAQSLGK